MAKRRQTRVCTPFVNDLPLEFLKCRAFGHRWEEFVPVGKRKAEFGFRFSLLCTTCGTERHDLLDTNGFVASREYVYSDGYKLDTATNRAECRLLYHDRRAVRRLARRGKLTVEHKGKT